MSHVLPNDRDILRLVHSDEALVLVAGDVGIFTLEINQSNLVAVLHQDEPVPEYTLCWGRGGGVASVIGYCV